MITYPLSQLPTEIQEQANEYQNTRYTAWVQMPTHYSAPIRFTISVTNDEAIAEFTADNWLAVDYTK